VIVWINEYFGLVHRDGKKFIDMAAYREHHDKVAGMVVLERRSPDTFGRDIEEMIIRKLTFDKVLQAGGFTLMSKQRLRMVQTQTFSQLEELNLLPQGPEEKLSA
jgi:hypothetical protein